MSDRHRQSDVPHYIQSITVSWLADDTNIDLSVFTECQDAHTVPASKILCRKQHCSTFDTRVLLNIYILIPLM